MSFIIHNGRLIAKTPRQIKSGTPVIFSTQRVEERINADRDWNLLNASHGKVSNDKKWDEKYMKSEGCFTAEEINYLEFLVYF